MATALNKSNLNNEVYNSQKPVIIDVSAEWCGPCRHMKPIFEQLSQELGTSYNFLELNVDEGREIAIEWGISSVPTFVFVKEGKVVGKVTGMKTKEELKQLLHDYLD